MSQTRKLTTVKKRQYKCNSKFTLSDFSETGASFTYDNFEPDAVILSVKYDRSVTSIPENNPTLELTFKDYLAAEEFYEKIKLINFPKDHLISLSQHTTQMNTQAGYRLFHNGIHRKDNIMSIYLAQSYCKEFILPLVHRQHPFDSLTVESLKLHCKIDLPIVAEPVQNSITPVLLGHSTMFAKGAEKEADIKNGDESTQERPRKRPRKASSPD